MTFQNFLNETFELKRGKTNVYQIKWEYHGLLYTIFTILYREGHGSTYNEWKIERYNELTLYDKSSVQLSSILQFGYLQILCTKQVMQ